MVSLDKNLISIVIPTRDLGCPGLRACLLSICEQKHPHFRIEVFVIVNGYKGLCSKLPENLAWIQVFDIGEAGVGRARNFGLSLAQGELVYFLDDDCVLPHASFLSRIENWYKNKKKLHPNLKVFGGGYLSDDKTTYWGCQYNEVVNTWLKSHRLSLVAGNWIGERKSLPDALFPDSDDFGGEEFRALQVMERMYGNRDYWLFKDLLSLSVYHRSTHSFTSFLLRAVLHGSAKRSFDKEKLFYGRSVIIKNLRWQGLLYYLGVFLGYWKFFYIRNEERHKKKKTNRVN